MLNFCRRIKWSLCYKTIFHIIILPGLHNIENFSYGLYFQRKGLQLVVVAADVHAHESWDDLADHPAMCVSANQVIVIQRVEGQLVDQILHPHFTSSDIVNIAANSAFESQKRHQTAPFD